MALHSSIAKRAFELYEAGGHPHGKDRDDWLEAERQILRRDTSLLSSRPTQVKAEPKKLLKKQAKTKKPST